VTSVCIYANGTEYTAPFMSTADKHCATNPCTSSDSSICGCGERQLCKDDLGTRPYFRIKTSRKICGHNSYYVSPSKYCATDICGQTKWRFLTQEEAERKGIKDTGDGVPSDEKLESHSDFSTCGCTKRQSCIDVPTICSGGENDRRDDIYNKKTYGNTWTDCDIAYICGSVNWARSHVLAEPQECPTNPHGTDCVDWTQNLLRIRTTEWWSTARNVPVDERTCYCDYEQPETPETPACVKVKKNRKFTGHISGCYCDYM